MLEVWTAIGRLVLSESGELATCSRFSSEEEAVEELLALENPPLQGYESFWRNEKAILEKAGVSYEEYREVRRRVALRLAEERVKASAGVETQLIWSVAALGDLNKAMNLLCSRLAAALQLQPPSEKMDVEDVEKTIEGAGESEVEAVKELSKVLQSLLSYRSYLEMEIDRAMESHAPNLRGLLGPLLGAQLLAVSKGLERLAAMPGSRIQVLGAGKAMARHLRSGQPPPKHGLLFQHPAISRSPWWQRGKIARTLAAKVAIAARLDAHSKEDRSEELREGFLRRYREVRERFPKEPRRVRAGRRRRR